jgi:hypothetical protein
MINLSATERILLKYSDYYEKHFTTRRFKHSDILPLIDVCKKTALFQVKLLGKSVEERDIFKIKWGGGKTKILLWSQMHGDEPTATMAIFDILNFLKADDEFNDIRELLSNSLTIYFVPMLNPDGTERVIRENAIGIDLNRDAQELVSPESKILKNIVENIKPQYGFNLHDQDIRWSAGGGTNPATIALLSPQFDSECTLNEVRKNAINVIANIYTFLNKYIPDCIAKYGEDYEPRSFGDSITGWGTSVILIEAGKRRSDPEKEFIRKIIFAAIVESFISISENNINPSALEIYKSIPSNGKLFYDVIFRNLSYRQNRTVYPIDIAINIEEYFDPVSREQYFEGTIENIGDLRSTSAYTEIDCSGMEVKPGRVYESSDSDLNKIEPLKLIAEGFTHIFLNEKNFKRFAKFPLNIICCDKQHQIPIQIKKPANFSIGDSEIRYTVVNGFVYDCKSGIHSIKNSIVF